MKVLSEWREVRRTDDYVHEERDVQWSTGQIVQEARTRRLKFTAYIDGKSYLARSRSP